MKRLGYLYEKLLDIDYIEQSIHKAFQKKKKTPGIKRILADPRKHAERIVRLIASGELPAMKHRRPRIIKDGVSHKERRIVKASDYEHIVHHAIIGLIQDKMYKMFYRYAVASIPGRGDLYGQKAMIRWIHSYHGKKLYVLKFDIRKFFDSVDREMMMQKLCRIIKDRRFLAVIHKVIYYDDDMNGIGIPIGFYTSQWFANLYLTDMDYYIKQDLQVQHMMRYADDVVILGRNKRKLHKIYNSISIYLSTNAHLYIKDNWQVFKLSYKPSRVRKLLLKPNGVYGRPLDYMGYKFYPWKTTIRKSTLRSAKRAAARFHRTHSSQSAMRIMSYYGRMKHCQVFRYKRRYLFQIAPPLLVSTIISQASRLKSITP